MLDEMVFNPSWTIDVFMHKIRYYAFYFKKISLMANYIFFKIGMTLRIGSRFNRYVWLWTNKVILRTLKQLNDNARPHILAIERHFCGNLMPNKTSKHVNNRSQLTKSCVEFWRIDIGCVNLFLKIVQKLAKIWQIVSLGLRMIGKIFFVQNLLKL